MTWDLKVRHGPPSLASLPSLQRSINQAAFRIHKFIELLQGKNKPIQQSFIVCNCPN